jgi:hypothetical protein
MRLQTKTTSVRGKDSVITLDLFQIFLLDVLPLPNPEIAPSPAAS